MNDKSKKDNLRESLKLCSIHHERMQYAFQRVKDKFPLNETKYNELLPDDLRYLEYFIRRKEI